MQAPVIGTASVARGRKVHTLKERKKILKIDDLHG